MNIIVDNIKKTFSEVNVLQENKSLEVLNGVNVIFEQGKSYAILGASGTGKSTFLHLLAGIDTPDSGTVSFDGKSISKMSVSEKDCFLNKTIGLMFQLPYLISEVSVIENVAMPGMIAGKSFDECFKDAFDVLKDLEISEKANCLPDSLSGGQQQRVALARAIFNKPKFLLADEPTGNLDPKTGKLIVDLLVKCKQKWGMGLIISSHDNYVAQNMENKFRLEGGSLNKL